MKKKLLYLSLSLLCICPAFAQYFYDFKGGQSYSRLIELSNQHKNEALHIADSLSVNSSSAIEYIEAKMASASIWANNGDPQEAIYFAFEALHKATKAEDTFSEASIQLFLATQFRNIGYPKYEEKFIRNAGKTISSLSLNNAKYHLKGEYLLEKGLAFLEEQNYRGALQEFQLAYSLFSTYRVNNKTKHLYLARNEYLLGTTYYYLEQFNDALSHYDQSYYYTKLSDPNGKISRAWIYHGYANLYLQMNDLSRSEKYFQKCLAIVEYTNNVTKKAVYESALKFYRVKNNLDSISRYSEKYISVLTTISQNQKGVLQSEVWRDQYQISGDTSNPFIYLGLGAAVIIGFVVIFNKAIFRNNILKISEIEQRKTEIKKVKNENYLPAATDQDLVEKLEDFEKKKKFLNNKMCLPRMAAQLQTNTKYLRYILKKHKSADYNSYINELRVSYIIEKINSDPNYLQYKISYLAKEAGFSSHSKFSKTFKKLTNYSPSEYIGKIKSIRT